MITDSDKGVVAAFDFDGTITYRDSLLSFLFFTHGYVVAWFKLFLLIPYFVCFFAGFFSRQRMKEKILRSFYGGEKSEEVQKLGNRFAIEKMDVLIRPEALKKIHWHLNEGHHCVIISASIDTYIIPWAERVGIHDVLSSRLEKDQEGKITGNLIGLNCWGVEKVRRLEEACGPCDHYTLYAYGDSRGDKELLEKADFSFYCTME